MMRNDHFTRFNSKQNVLSEMHTIIYIFAGRFIMRCMLGE